MRLTDKYRPRALAEVIGQSAIAKRIDELRPRGLAGRNWFICGASGQGKTSIARIIAAEVADGHSDFPLHDFNGNTVGRAKMEA